MSRERAVDEVDAVRGEADQAATPIVVDIAALHQPAFDQAVDTLGETSRGHHGVGGQLAGGQLVGRARTSQRCEQIKLRFGERELGIHRGELLGESARQTMQAPDHPLRRGIQIRPLATPLLLDAVDMICHASTIPSMEARLSSVEDKRLRWVLLTAIAPIAWGSTYFVTRHLLPPDAALWGAVIRCLPAGILVLLIVRRLPRGSWWWRSIMLGTLTVGGLNVLVYVAAQRLATSLAATIMSTSAAALLILSWIVLRQRPRALAVAGAAIGIVGVVVMLQPGGDAGGVDVWGVGASIIAMFSSSLGFVLTRKWGPDVPPLTMTAWQLIAGSLVVVPIAVIVEGAPPALDPPALLGFTYVILIATAVAYGAWFAGLAHLPGAAVGIIGLLNPVTGVVLGVSLAGEPFGPAQIVGLGLVMVGVLAGVIPQRATARASSGAHQRQRAAT